MLNKNVKPKKVPVKGEIVRHKEQKPCSDCGKMKPLANKTKRLCATCMVKQRKEKQKARKEYKKRIKNYYSKLYICYNYLKKLYVSEFYLLLLFLVFVLKELLSLLSLLN